MRRRATAHATARELSVVIESGVATLRLTRAAAGNRINQSLAQELCDATAVIEHDDTVRVVVLGALGDSFCCGVEDGGAWQQRFDWVAAIGGLTRPVLAVIQGDAVAEGCELALACDLRLCSNRARFSLPQLYEGRLPVHGGTQRLPRVVGRSRALDLLLTGRTINAAEAKLWGLTSQVVPQARLAEATRRLVAELCRKGPLALRYAKEAVVKGTDMTLEQGIRLEEDLYALLQTTQDRRTGVRAFLQKQSPRFRGR